MDSRTSDKHIQGDSGFSLGFFCGALLGAVGVYLTVVPEGQKLKTKLMNEFESYKKKLEAETPEDAVSAFHLKWQTKLEQLRQWMGSVNQYIRSNNKDSQKTNHISHNSYKKKHYFKAK